jgi:hypothetical protein
MPVSRFVWKAILAALMLICPDVADAQSAKDIPANAAWSAGFMVSTLGPGLQISYRALDWAVVRAEGSYVSVPTDGLTLSLQSAGALLDLHPFGSGFRISGGLRYFDYEIRGIATVNESSGGVSTPNRFRVEATNSNKAAPYAGLGFDTSHFSGGAYEFRLGLDFGVVYSGKPVATVANLDNPGADIQTELNKIIGEYRFLDFYPVATLSARLTF